MIKNKDIIGKQFGELTVLYLDKEKTKSMKREYYVCQCSCENKTIKSFRKDVLTSEKIKSCGCLNKNNNYCCICNSKDRVVFSNKYNDYLCHKHYMQVYHTNEVKVNFMKDKNEIVVYNTYAEIILYDRKHNEKARALIDLEDIDKCKIYKWGLTSNGYVISKLPGNKYILLHRYLLNLDSNDSIDEYLEGDHKDHNRLNNRKYNLREVTESQNNMNAFKPSNNTSGVKGISWSKKDNLWHTYIGINDTRINLGWFKNFEDAVNCRLEAEEKYFGEYSIYKNVEGVLNDNFNR